MGRLVKGASTRRAAAGSGLEATTRTGGAEMEMVGGSGDNYLERIIKYIPSEIVAAYVALDGIFFNTSSLIGAPSGIVDPATTQPVSSFGQSIMAGVPASTIGLGIFLVCLAFTPIYIWSTSRLPGEAGRGAWRMQALVSTLAFVVWAYATKGMVFLAPGLVGDARLYDGQLAAAVLILFTLVSGLFIPSSSDYGSERG